MLVNSNSGPAAAFFLKEKLSLPSLLFLPFELSVFPLFFSLFFVRLLLPLFPKGRFSPLRLPFQICEGKLFPRPPPPFLLSQDRCEGRRKGNQNKNALIFSAFVHVICTFPCGKLGVAAKSSNFPKIWHNAKPLAMPTMTLANHGGGGKGRKCRMSFSLLSIHLSP